jgi:catechol 2,3-dioxygenase-like lactoylglutathione lyase family enzyme
MSRNPNPHHCVYLAVILIGCTVLPMTLFADENEQTVGITHIGLWVSDVDTTLAFLNELSDFEKFFEANRSSGGTRTYVRDGKGQVIEILNAEDVKPHPEFDRHPYGRVAGTAHIAVRVENTILLRDRLTALGYKVLRQVPENESDGYTVKGRSGEGRLLFVEGPDRITYELFEAKGSD